MVDAAKAAEKTSLLFSFQPSQGWNVVWELNKEKSKEYMRVYEIRGIRNNAGFFRKNARAEMHKG